MKREFALLAIPILLLACAFAPQPVRVQAQDTIEYIALPSDSLPMGLLHDPARGCVWVALQMNCSIAKIDDATKSVLGYYYMPWIVDVFGQEFRGLMPRTLTLDDAGNIWISINDDWSSPSFCYHYPSVVEFNVDTETFTIYPTDYGRARDIKFFNGFVWVLLDTNINNEKDACLAKIEPRTGDFVANYTLPIPYSTNLPQGSDLELDGNDFWFSFPVFANKVFRFNTETEAVDVELSGFDTPCGLESDEKYVYVAEFTETAAYGTIAMINKKDLSVTRIVTAARSPSGVNRGTYDVLKDQDGVIWWTDGSCHVGAKDLTFALFDNVYNTSEPFGYYLAEVPGKSIWFSCVGSAYVGTYHLPRSIYDFNKDAVVNLRDISMLCQAYGTTNQTETWKEPFDLIVDGKVNMRDIAAGCQHFGERE